MDLLAAATAVSASDVDRLLVAAHAQMQEHDIRFLTIPMREKGLRVLTSDEDLVVTDSERELFVVSGADDTVIATMAAALAAGLETETAMELANRASGVVLGKPGTVAIGRADLIGLLQKEEEGIRSSE
jgi:D-beta-D-heptose 7-phosphate kinase/D-beta-D-heptose 1-phosphate adenosyltransferase